LSIDFLDETFPIAPVALANLGIEQQCANDLDLDLFGNDHWQFPVVAVLPKEGMEEMVSHRIRKADRSMVFRLSHWHHSNDPVMNLAVLEPSFVLVPLGRATMG
jgi:hypothetical protein